MKILFLSPILPYPCHNGASIRIYNCLKKLSIKYEVHFICFAGGNTTIESVEHMKNIVYSVDCILWNPPIRNKWYLFKNLFSLLPLRIKRFYSMEMQNLIEKKMDKIKFDIVHISFLQMYQYAKLIFNKEQLVLEEHNIEYNILKGIYETKQNMIKKMYWFYEYKKLKKYEEKVLKEIKYCIAVSDIDKKIFQKENNNKKIFVIENGVDTKYFSTKSKDLGRALIFTGALNAYENFDAVKYFIEDIFPLINKKMPDIIFFIIGKVDSFVSYYKEIKENQVQNVKIISNPEDIRPYLKLGTIFIVPLRIGSGTRLKILNAMSMGCAVVSTSLGAEGLNVRHNHNIIIQDDPLLFARTIINLLKNKKRAVKIGENARDFVRKKYDWEKITLKFDDVYKNMIQRELY